MCYFITRLAGGKYSSPFLVVFLIRAGFFADWCVTRSSTVVSDMYNAVALGQKFVGYVLWTVANMRIEWLLAFMRYNWTKIRGKKISFNNNFISIVNVTITKEVTKRKLKEKKSVIKKCGNNIKNIGYSIKMNFTENL